MEEVGFQLVVTAVGLALVGLAYFVWLVTGIANNMFSIKKWSWKRTLEDVMKTLLICVGIFASVILLNGIEWYSYQLGYDITQVMDKLTPATLFLELLTASIWYAKKGFSNIKNFLNKDHILDGEIVQVRDSNYKEIATQTIDTVNNFIESITKKSIREQLQDEGLLDKKIDGKDIEVEQDGYGSGNTYPNPYRSAIKDSMTDPSTCYNRECVSYTSWKICELTGKWPERTGSMNAKEWIYRLPSWGYKQVSSPKDGGKYIGVLTSGTYGHVVWFESEINSTTVQISEYNYKDEGNYGVRNISKSSYIWYEISKESQEQKEEKKELSNQDTITYTYKQGDTFGQVILDLGLNTSHGLWGPDGDVEYYTKQQNIIGNVPIGTVLTFTRRK